MTGDEYGSNFTYGTPAPPMCRMFQNQTESIRSDFEISFSVVKLLSLTFQRCRLESELRGWFNLEPETPRFKLDLESPKRRPDSTSRPTPKPKRPRKEVKKLSSSQKYFGIVSQILDHLASKVQKL